MIKRGHSCVYRECVIVARSYINKILAKVDVVMEASAPCIREGGGQIGGHWSGRWSGGWSCRWSGKLSGRWVVSWVVR